MAKTKIGTLSWCEAKTPLLARFRIMPEPGSMFPSYKAGQYIALRRDDCRLTKKVVGQDGRAHYVPDLDEKGQQKRGPVTHSYSIASAPIETFQKQYLEFYIILEKHADGTAGRLTESIFRMNPDGDNKITYFDLITGTFTLEKRAAGCENVVMVGTGTGLAPFRSMLKQLDEEAKAGNKDNVRYTLFHTNRTFEELDYYDELSDIARAARFDFVYVPTVSRAGGLAEDDLEVGRGRANNVLRLVLGMPLKEQADLDAIEATGGDLAAAEAALARTMLPMLPADVSREKILARMGASKTVLMTCGNPDLMADIKTIAEANSIRFEKEDW
jgi:ferredoxin-NADP reductase